MKAAHNKIAREIYEWVETFCIALAVVVVVFTCICRFVTVDGESMETTLQHGDRLIISDMFYTPETGDIVVLQDLEDEFLKGPIIKRVIATEGETVDIDFDTWEVTVTDKEGNIRVLDESYVNKVDSQMAHMTGVTSMYPHAVVEYPHVVAENCVFVMGDNRNNSLDSRFLGDIDERKILGKAYIRLFPFNKIGLMK